MLATNDPDNGNDTGRVSCVEIHPSATERPALRLECVRHEPTCSVRLSLEKVPYVRIGHKTFPIGGHRDWYGNWCWRAVWVRRDVAARMANHLRSMGKFIDFCEPKSSETTQGARNAEGSSLSMGGERPQKSVGTSGPATPSAIPKGQPGSCV